MTTSNYTVTVLGLGAMGLPMATRLASQLTVHGFDIAEPRLKLAEDAGIATFATAREAAKGADAVLLAVRNGEQLNDVLFGELQAGFGDVEAVDGQLGREARGHGQAHGAQAQDGDGVVAGHGVLH